MKLKIDSIIIDERIRQEIGDISLLRDSIKEIGLLNPPIVNEENKLLGGYRRLEACRQLGWTEIDVNIIKTSNDNLKNLDVEYHENIGRLNLSIDDQQIYMQKRLDLLNPPQPEHPFIVWIKQLWQKIKAIFQFHSSEKNKVS